MLTSIFLTNPNSVHKIIDNPVNVEINVRQSEIFQKSLLRDSFLHLEYNLSFEGGKTNWAKNKIATTRRDYISLFTLNSLSFDFFCLKPYKPNLVPNVGYYSLEDLFDGSQACLYLLHFAG